VAGKTVRKRGNRPAFTIGLVSSGILSLLASVLIFYPALADFGGKVIGTEDMKLVIWTYWHYANAFESGADPLFADEIFYPEGIYITRTPLMIFLAAAHFLLPAAWTVFAKITFIQIVSFAVGGIAAFAFCYKAVRSLYPALLGSAVFNFSIFHLQQAVHFLNYAAAFPFVPVFFYFYMDLYEGRKEMIAFALLSLSLLLIAISEITVALMIGLLVMVDVFAKYMRELGVGLDWKKALVLVIAGLISLALSVILAAIPKLLFLLYFLPPAIFIGSAVFFVIGGRSLIAAEEKLGIFRALAVCAVPTILYSAMVGLLPSYEFVPDLTLYHNMLYPVPIEYLLLPSDFQLVGNVMGLASTSESGVNLGIGVLILIAVSVLARDAAGVEKRYRDLFLISVLFSFPVVVAGDHFLAISPFHPQTLFPMLSVLRAPSRFMLFAMLFASVLSAMAIKRIADKGGNIRILAIGLAMLVALERIPDYGPYIFNPQMPQFYNDLAKADEDSKIFLYPYLDYYNLLDEAYYQTIHGKKLSHGVLSRRPVPEHSVLSGIYAEQFASNRTIDYVKSKDYDYIVVQKKKCMNEHDCFVGVFAPIDATDAERIRVQMELSFGMPIYQDDSIIVYKNRPSLSQT
jgi:hypothetical protein